MIDNVIRVLIIVVVLSFVGKVFAGAGQAAAGGAAVASSMAAFKNLFNEQAKASAENLTTSAKLKKACSGFMNAAACVGAVLSGAQGVAMIVSAFKNSNSADQYTCQSAVCNGYGGDGPPDFTLDPPPDISGPDGNTSFRLSNKNIAQAKNVLRSLENNLEELSGLGYTFDPTTGTVTTPKGKVSSASLSSPEAMAQAGFSSSEIKQFQKILEDTKKANANKTLASYGFDEKNLFEESGTSKKQPNPMNANSDDLDLNEFMKRFQKNLNSPQRGVAGLQKMYGNQPVGVAGDNLFEMINRRYQSENQKGTFLVEKRK